MKFSTAITTAILSAAAVSGQPARRPQTGRNAVGKMTMSRAASNGSVSIDGTSFVIDGKKGYMVGSNAYWLPFQKNNQDVDTVFQHLKQSGVQVLRVWGFNIVNSTPTDGSVWFQSFTKGQGAKINNGTDGLQRMDYVVKAAEASGVKLVIPLNNNWDAYGGLPAYKSFFNLSSDKDFYTGTAPQKAYMDYAKTIVTRYASSSAIFSWELMNEPRCKGCDTSVITNWAKTVSAQIKQWAPHHLVALGDEGWAPAKGDGSYPYTTTEGVDFAANLKIPTLDYGTAHMYPEDWGVTDPNFPAAWIQAHGAACKAANKPCVMEEYGSKANHAATEGAWQKTMLSTDGIAGDQIWQYGDTLSTGKTADDGYTVYYGTDDFTQLVTSHAKAAGSAGSGGSNSTMTYPTKPNRSTSTKFNQPAKANNFNQPAKGNQFNQPAKGNQFNKPAKGNQFNKPAKGNQFNKPAKANRFAKHQ